MDPLKFTIDTDKPPASAAPKRGPGRPKGSTNAPRANAQTDAATLRQALATMDSLYAFTGATLLVFGLSQTATDWAERSEALAKSNEDALKAAPKLARAIASAGSVGGATTFIVAHVMATTALVQGATRELAARRAAVQTVKDSDTVD